MQELGARVLGDAPPTSTSTITSSQVALPGRAGKRELQALVSRLARTPLDPARPLWQFHLVENYRGGSALIARIHHCYADGIALVQVLLSMTDVGAGRPAGDAVAPPATKARRDADDPLARAAASRSPA